METPLKECLAKSLFSVMKQSSVSKSDASVLKCATNGKGDSSRKSNQN